MVHTTAMIINSSFVSGIMPDLQTAWFQLKYNMQILTQAMLAMSPSS